MRKLLFRLLLLIFIFLLITFILVIGLSYLKYRTAINELSLDDAINTVRAKENYTKFEDISKDYVDAVVAVEDHRFYEHKGVDLISLAHSMYVNFRSKSMDYGASTITQQLARNMYFTQEKSPFRKIAEIFVANDIEKKYSKEDILELYFNIIYFGNGYYGIYDASYGFFNKSPKDLTYYEATYLAGLPNAPSIYSQDKELAEQRRLQVVNAMENN